MITDELLHHVTPVIPISEWKRIANEAFNLTVHEVDAIERSQTRTDVIFHLLHQAVQRDQMPAKVLKQKIEDAQKSGVKIGLKELESLETRNGIMTMTMNDNDNDNDNDNEIELFRHHNGNNTNIKVIYTNCNNCKNN